jgi:NADPH:quinone reductase-like Zn-dependent oxidoreductase
MDELKKNNIDGVHTVFITSEIDGYLPTIPDFVLPFGNVLAIGDSPTVNISHLKRKAISFHWELMFTKSLNQYRMESQGEILKQVGDLIDKGKIKTTVNHTLKGLNAENIKKAHEIVESGASIGKVVITA